MKILYIMTIDNNFEKWGNKVMMLSTQKVAAKIVEMILDVKNSKMETHSRFSPKICLLELILAFSTPVKLRTLVIF